MAYSGGDWCQPDGQKARTLKVWVACNNDPGISPSDEVVLESSMCNYDFFLKSAFGCPSECPLVPAGDGTGAVYLCARHGVCDYDAEINKPRCFCNDGWSGGDCASQASAPATGLSAVGGVLLTVGLLLVATLGFLCVSCVVITRRLSSAMRGASCIKDPPTPYGPTHPLLYCCSVFLWNRIRSLRLDPSAYSSLRGEREDKPTE